MIAPGTRTRPAWTRCTDHQSREASEAGGERIAMAEERKPNIVFVLCDNTGWGDFSCYGGLTPTPRIDKLASEGMQLNNYNVESQCTPSRSAIMTGRQSVRS